MDAHRQKEIILTSNSSESSWYLVAFWERLSTGVAFFLLGADGRELRLRLMGIGKTGNSQNGELAKWGTQKTTGTERTGQNGELAKWVTHRSLGKVAGGGRQGREAST